MKRNWKWAALIAAMTLALAGSMLAQDRDGDDDDRGYYGRGGNGAQARQYGYQQGYQDGLRHGREERRENDPGDFRSKDWESASRGYQSWMGPFGQYKNGYRDGYSSGYTAAFRQDRGGWGGNRRGDGDHDADDGYGRYPSNNYPYGYPGSSYPNGYPASSYPNGGYGGYGNNGNVGYNYGYQDGANVARQDMSSGKPYNPNPRGKYEDEDTGYRSVYGSKSAYRSQYAQGYRAGYESTFRGYRRGY